jgi:hypothetical protein
LLLLKRCSFASLDELLLRPLCDCFSRQASSDIAARMILLELDRFC